MKKSFFITLFALLIIIPSLVCSPQRMQFLYDQLINADNFKVRIAAAYEIGKIADGSLAPHLEQAFQEEDNAAVRLAILDALSQIPDHRILQTLLYLSFHHVLSSEEQSMIKKIIWNHREAFSTDQWALHALTSPYDKQRAMSFWILSIIGNKEVEPFLIKGLEDQSPIVLKRVVSNLQEFPSKETKTACSTMKKHTMRSIQSMANFCVQAINYRLKNTYTSPYKSNLQNLTPIQALLSPRNVEAYFLEKQSDMELDNAYAPIQVQSNQIKNLTFDSKEVISSTVVESYIESEKDYKSIDIEIIKAFIKQKFPLIQGCYENRLEKKPKLKGQVTISFHIQAEGKVSKTMVQKKTIDDQILESCIIQRFGELRFPSVRNASIKAQYTFHFSPPEKKLYLFKGRS